jgi:hypothetical protein
MDDSVGFGQESFVFKLLETLEWMDRSFRELWGSISWNPLLKLKYPNLLMGLQSIG